MSKCMTVTTRWAHPLRLPLLIPLAGLLAVVGLMLAPVSQGFGMADAALPVVAVALAVVGLLLVLARQSRLRLTATDLLLCAWLLYGLLRAWCAPGVPCLPAVLRGVSLVALYAGLRLTFSYAVPSTLATESAVSGFALLQCLLCLFQMATGSSRHALFPFTGTFLNPGPCSAVLFMGACLGLYRYFYPISSRHTPTHRAYSVLTIATLVLCTLLLPLGWSRAALLGGAVCLLVVAWPRLTSRLRLSVLAAMLLAGLLLYLLKRGSADGRVLFYAISSHSVASHPLWGTGPGTFFHAYAQATASLYAQLPMALARHAGTLDYALCDGMRVAVEQGLVGLLLALSWVATVLWQLRRRSPALALVLLGLLVFSLFSYPFQLLPFQLLLVLLAAYAAGGSGAAEASDACSRHAGGISVYLVAGVFAVTSAILVLPPIRARVRATEQSRLIVGRDSPRMLPQYERLLPLMRHDAQFLFRYGQALAACGRYNDSNWVLAQGALVSNDAMLHVLRGHNYRHLHACTQAARAYRQAHAQCPARQYPLLCLMRLYRQAGQQARARQVAHMLLAQPVEARSPLSREIRDEAKSCILEQ